MKSEFWIMKMKYALHTEQENVELIARWSLIQSKETHETQSSPEAYLIQLR